MAIWQFDLQLMPDPIVADIPSCIEGAIGEDGLDTANWWLENQPTVDFINLINKFFSTKDSWFEDVLRWGDEDEVLIEVFFEKGLVECISVRIDVRNLNHRQIKEMMTIAEALNCHIYVMETQDVVEPSYNLLLPHIENSRAARYAFEIKE